MATVLLAFATAAAPAAAASRAQVAVDRLNLRAAPSRDGRVLAVLDKGTEVTVLAHDADWLKVRAGERVGWLRNRPRYVTLRTDRAPAGRIETIRRQAEDIDRRIAQGQAEVRQITAREREVIAELDRIEQRLDAGRRELAGLEDEMTALAARIAETGRQVRHLRRESRQVEDYLARRLRALYKLHWLGRVQVLAGAPTVNDFLRRESALRHILAADHETLRRFDRQRDELQQLLATLAEQRRRQADLAAEIDGQVRASAAERARRRQLLEEIASRKSLELASIEALKKAARQLDDTIRRLREAAVPDRPASSAAVPFRSRRGLLNMPVSGKIINLFGPYRNARFNVMNFRSGIDIRAEKGEPVRAVHGGRVLYASWFKGYGNMLIIDHGDAYYTVYAHAEELFKVKGAPVEAGEVVATVGDTGSMEGAKLYFEIRHHGKPEDPLGWLETG